MQVCLKKPNNFKTDLVLDASCEHCNEAKKHDPNLQKGSLFYVIAYKMNYENLSGCKYLLKYSSVV